MNTGIDYDKYSNMTRGQLLASLTNAEKRDEKLRAEVEKKLNANKELIRFLKVKIKESLDNPKYYTLENSPAMKQFKQWKKENPQEAEQIRQELEAEMKGYYENNNSAQS